MRRLLTLLAGLLLGAGLMLLVLFGFRDQLFAVENIPEAISVEVGAPAPDFRLTELNGREVALSDWQGKVVLLNFWATWCAPCRLEMPGFAVRAGLYPDDLAVVAVNYQEDRQTVQPFVAEMGIDFPVLLDVDGRVNQLYRVRGYPTTYLIDPAGTIRIVHLGMLSENQLDEYLIQLGIE